MNRAKARKLDRRSSELLRDAHYLRTNAWVHQARRPRDRRLKRLMREADRLVDDSLEVRNEVRSALKERSAEGLGRA